MITVYCLHYISGSGGNFLGRVFSLDENLVGMGSNGIGSTLHERRNSYNYSTLPFAYNDYKNNWVKYELEVMHLPLAIGIEKLSQINARLVEPIEPELFYDKLDLFGSDDVLHHMHIDVSNCKDWVNQQKEHKRAHVVRSEMIPVETDNDIIKLDKVVKEFNSYPISLENIISSDNDFIKEYEKACKYCQIKNYNDIALEIYWSWKKTWANQA